MYSERRHITTLVTRWLLCLWGVIGLAACSADSEPEEDTVGDVLQLSADTRAGNLVTIEGAGAEGSSIYIFTAIANTTATQKQGTAVMTDDKWHSSIRVKKEQQYYLYGYDMDLTDEIIDKFVTKENVQKMAKTIVNNNNRLKLKTD